MKAASFNSSENNLNRLSIASRFFHHGWVGWLSLLHSGIPVGSMLWRKIDFLKLQKGQEQTDVTFTRTLQRFSVPQCINNLFLGCFCWTDPSCSVIQRRSGRLDWLQSLDLSSTPPCSPRKTLTLN